MGNYSGKPVGNPNPEECICRNSQFKFKWCSCGKSKPSNESPTKIRFWIDTEKMRNGIAYNALEIPEHAKTDQDRDSNYQQLVRELQEYSKQIERDAKK